MTLFTPVMISDFYSRDDIRTSVYFLKLRILLKLGILIAISLTFPPANPPEKGR